MVIAVDFDGTIVENNYPEIGEPKLFVFESLQEIEKAGHQIILFTTRTGNLLNEAVEFCRNNGIEFYAINRSYPEEKLQDMGSRKIMCDVFISDKNFGGLPGWGEIWQQIQATEQGNFTQSIGKINSGNSFLSTIKSIFKRK